MAHLDDQHDDDWDDWLTDTPEPWDHRDGQPPRDARNPRRPAWMDDPDVTRAWHLRAPVDADMDRPPPGCEARPLTGPEPLASEEWASRAGFTGFVGVLVFLTLSAVFGNGGDGPSLGMGLGLIFGIMVPLGLAHRRAPSQVWPGLIATDTALATAVLLWLV